MTYKHYHFIGVGGIGMGALASLVLDKNFQVSGSDVRNNAMVLFLENKGAKIFIGHDKGNIKGADCIIYSSAISEDNIEIKAARELKIPIIKRAQLLAELMKNHIGITVGGAHGKTTTTSLISHILEKANYNPTTAVGGLIHGKSSNASIGDGKYFIAEVDESDGTFLYFRPRYSVITNVDLEHVDYYKNWDNVLLAYKRFIGNTEKDGLIFICGDDTELLKITQFSERNYKTYGFGINNDVTVKNFIQDKLRSQFDCIVDGKNFGQVEISIPGKHNVLNALAAISLSVFLKIDFQVIVDALKNFKGVKRRFDIKGEVSNITIVDDYAHHPSEIKATLQAADLLEKKRKVVVFQPHRYTRLKQLINEFVDSLKNVDYLIITDVYAASENEIEGINAINLVKKIQEVSTGEVIYKEKELICLYLMDLVKPGDLLMTLGAGDITNVSDQMFGLLSKNKIIHEKINI